MTARVLSIVGAAYRGTVEEQDDTILWLTSMCSGAGLDVAVLLEGDAVNYAARGHAPPAVRLGGSDVAAPPAMDRDVEALLAAGVPVHYVTDDADRLGLAPAALVDGLKPVARSELPSLFDGFDQTWRW